MDGKWIGFSFYISRGDIPILIELRSMSPKFSVFGLSSISIDNYINSTVQDKELSMSLKITSTGVT